MTLGRLLLVVSASYFLGIAAQNDYSVAQVPLIYFRADEFLPSNSQYIHSDFIDPNSGDVLIQPPSENNRDVQEGPLSVNEISQLKDIIRERQPVTADVPSDRNGRNQDLSQNFNPDIYTSGDAPQNRFQGNAQPTFRNNEQNGPTFQNGGPFFPNNVPSFQNDGQANPTFPINDQPGPNFQNKDQSAPNFSINSQFDPNFSNNGHNGLIFQNNDLPGPIFQDNVQPNFPQNGRPGSNFQNNGQPGSNIPANPQFDRNFPNNAQPSPNFQINEQPGPNFHSNIQSVPSFSSNGQQGPSIVSPTLGPVDNNNNFAVITEFQSPSEIRTEPAPPQSVNANDVIHTSKVYQGNSYAPPAPEGNAVHVEHHVEHHETIQPNDPLVHNDNSFAHVSNNGLENHPSFPTPASIHLHDAPVGLQHFHDNQTPHFNGPFQHLEHPSHFEILSGPFSQNDGFNAHFTGHHGPSEFSGNGINAVYGPFDASSFDPNFFQQNAVILNNADTFFSQHLPNLPLFPHSNYEQNQFVFPQGFPQPSSLPLSHSNFPEFSNFQSGPTVVSISNQGDVITPSTQAQSNVPSPDTFTAQPPPNQQLAGPNSSPDF